jgi:3-phosphoinositide dependent protein kinase-1
MPHNDDVFHTCRNTQSSSSSVAQFNINDVMEVARQKASAPSLALGPRTCSLWNRFLMDDEHIKMSGLISKRKGLFSKKRQLILTSKPRLIYIDPIRMKQKGEIPWSDSLYVQLKSTTAFDVIVVSSPSKVLESNIIQSVKY